MTPLLGAPGTLGTAWPRYESEVWRCALTPKTGAPLGETAALADIWVPCGCGDTTRHGPVIAGPRRGACVLWSGPCTQPLPGDPAPDRSYCAGGGVGVRLQAAWVRLCLLTRDRACLPRDRSSQVGSSPRRVCWGEGRSTPWEAPTQCPLGPRTAPPDLSTCQPRRPLSVSQP